jgi:hypothetical protein
MTTRSDEKSDNDGNAMISSDGESKKTWTDLMLFTLAASACELRLHCDKSTNDLMPAHSNSPDGVV